MRIDHSLVEPTVLSLLVVAVAVLAFLLSARRTFRRHTASPERESDLPKEQLERFKVFDQAASLQVLANQQHNAAIRAKVRYQAIGVAAATGAPALIWLSAAMPSLVGRGLASETGETLARACIALGILAVLWFARSPTKDHIMLRLRAELLRCYLHMYLARVGPFTHNANDPATHAAEVIRSDTPELLVLLRRVERMCEEQAADNNQVFDATVVDRAEAMTYGVERLDEQDAYFDDAQRRMLRAYDGSAYVALGVIAAAGALALAGVFITQATASLSSAFLLFSGIGVLLLGLRAVFGWDSKAGLYVRQAALLKSLKAELNRAIAQLGSSDAASKTAGAAFRRGAARYESLMAREAADWALVSDRRFYDVTP